MQDHLSATFAALSDPTRRGILARLVDGDATVNELVEPFDLSQPTISKHLKVLESAGLISRRRVAQSRPCHLEARALLEVDAWLHRYRKVLEANFARLDGVLETLKSEQREKQTTKRGKRT